MMKRLMLLPIAALATLVGPAHTQPAQNAALPALNTVQAGQWQLKSRSNPAENRSLCVSDVRALLQVRHGSAMCNRFVIASGAKETTVHYTCPGSGHGRTTIRVETSKLIQIESQGIAGREPFNVMFEGRRTGECRIALHSSGR